MQQIQRDALVTLEARFKELPALIPGKEMSEVRGYLKELQEASITDYSTAGLRALAESIGHAAAYKSRTARLLTAAIHRESVVAALIEDARFALRSVRAAATESDDVQGITRPDLRRERVFSLSEPFEGFYSKIASRLCLVVGQRESLKVFLKELSALQQSFSRKLAAMEMEMRIGQGEKQ